MNRLYGAVLVLFLLLGLSHQAGAQGRYASYFYPSDEILRVRVSPNGRWLAATATTGGKSGVLAQQIGSAEVRTLQTLGKSASVGIHWIGDNTLMTVSSRQWTVFRFSANQGGTFETERESVISFGWLVSALPLKDGILVWEFEHGGHNYVQRVTVDELVRFGSSRRTKAGPPYPGTNVAKIEGSASRWIVDSEGIPRVAVRTEANSYSVLYRDEANSDFTVIANYQAGQRDLLNPFQFTPDGERLVVAAYNGHDTIGIHEYDPVSRKIVKEVYQNPLVSVEWIHFDSVTGDVQSFSYTEGTVTHREYLDSARLLFAGRLSKNDPPLESLRVVSSSADRETFVYWVTGPTEPGAHYVRINALDETILVGRKGAGISRELLAKVESFNVTSKDGTVVEALLSLPSKKQNAPHPLVVMPHGGPIGVQDRQRFDPIIQYLASWGYAVLQVNFRGSTGYGLDFQKAGKKQWATGMADDLDAATSLVMTRPDIDAERMCILGGSYGGFAAVSALYRHTERFRCGVTINGVSDILLLGETSDMADSDAVVRQLQRNAGSFTRDRENLISISPAYNVSKIESPLMIVHGDLDRRVDIDHAQRLIVMLDLYDKPYEELVIPDAQHSLTPQQWIRLLPKIQRFLSKHTSIR